MALVDYSDSESDDESGPAQQPKHQPPAAKPAFQKAAPGKIKVDLPSIKPEPGQNGDSNPDGPPAKRARTGGAFSGFNSLLPAPKRVANNAPKAGVSLKTSSEAAFSRNPLPSSAPTDHESSSVTQADEVAAPPEEPKLVGKATRFLPLSVSNKKKKKPAAKPPPVSEKLESTGEGQHSKMAKAVAEKVAKEVESAPKPKRSLFSVQQEEEQTPVQPSDTGGYEPMMAQEGRAYLPEEIEQPITSSAPANPSSLEATAADLNLTPAQRRQLFGRHGGKDTNVMHFNLDNEYAANEQMRQAGELVEHRAVKSIAPGKHSLQQLVNNARTQSDAMEDKWAEGRRNRGEGGSKYGWTS